MKRFFIPIAVFAIIIGCVTAPSLPPTPQAETMPARQVEANVCLGADPYSQLERQKEFFGVDFIQANILPVPVFLENRGDKPLLVRPAEIYLELPDGRWNSPMGTDAAADKVFERGRRAGMVVGTLLGGATGLVSAMSASQRSERTSAEEFKKRELKEITLERGQSAHGFLYYGFPEGLPELTGMHLTAKLLEAGTQRSLAVRARLK